MRSDSRFRDVCPRLHPGLPRLPGARGHEGASTDEGRLAFTIGSQLVAEIDAWPTCSKAGRRPKSCQPAEAAEMTEAAAAHLVELLEDGLPAADLTEAVTDAAVVFLLAMKRHGISDPKRIPACTVMWNGRDARERVFFGS